MGAGNRGSFILSSVSSAQAEGLPDRQRSRARGDGNAARNAEAAPWQATAGRAASILSSISGQLRMRTPQALNTALASAAPAPLMPSSPTPLIWSGLVLSSTSGKKMASMAGMSACTGTGYSARSWLTKNPKRGSMIASSCSAEPTPQIMSPSACEVAVFMFKMRPAANTPSMRHKRISPESMSTATSAKCAP